MLRLTLFAILAGAVAVSAYPAEGSDTEFCAGETECPADCGYVSRNAKCIFCQCGPGPLKPGEFVVSASKGCPPGTVLGQQLGETQTCVPGGPVPTPPGAGCPHGPSFIDECDNDCSCIDNQFYGCTRKACRPGQTPEKPMTCEGLKDLPERKARRVICHEGIVKLQDKEAACLPGSVFADDCNTCFCSDTGAAGCTLKFCLPEEEPKSGCPHGQEFIDECGNQCSCQNGGFYGCTFKGCPDGARPEVPMSCTGPADVPQLPGKRVSCLQGVVRVQDKEENCLPGAEFMDECNTCTCSDAGVPGCTFKACLPTQRKGGCPYGAAYIDECGNDCSCVGGDFYGCSRRGCPDGKTAEKPMSCDGRTVLPTRRNLRVSCHEDIVKVQKKEEQCLPGSFFADDCNSCTCSESGMSGCTLELCLPEDDPQVSCAHGHEFIDECGNQCKCQNAEFYGCTFKACEEGQNPATPMTCDGLSDGMPEIAGRRVSCHEGIVRVQDQEEDCLPGAVFANDCNRCTCSDNGVAACTLKGCLQVVHNITDAGACAHGQEFIDECNNDCKCIDNQFYGCTRKACKPGERPEVPMTCTEDSNLPKRAARRVFCHEGKVKLQDKDADCLPGSRFMNDCNQCFCSDSGVAGCTLKLCL